MISTHALTWSATAPDDATRSMLEFQLTHSRGVRPPSLIMSIAIAPFQLTHSRGVRLGETVFLTIDDISTHALTWSATTLAVKQGKERQFQLTHSRGVRPAMRRSCT